MKNYSKKERVWKKNYKSKEKKYYLNIDPYKLEGPRVTKGNNHIVNPQDMINMWPQPTHTNYNMDPG